MGGGGKSSQPSSTTTSTVRELPEEVKPYLDPYMKRASEASYAPYQSFGNRITPLDPGQQVGMNAQLANAYQGQYVGSNLMGELGTTGSGGYLHANPYLDATFNQAARNVADVYKYATAPSFAASGIKAGAFGDNSGFQQQQMLNQYGLGQNLNNLATDIYGGNYQQERNRMMQAASMFPSMYQGLTQPAQTMMGVGDIYRDYNQALMNQQYEDWTAQKQHPYNMIDVLGNAIGVGGGTGGTTTQTQPGTYKPNPYANLMGAGLLGYGLMKNL